MTLTLLISFSLHAIEFSIENLCTDTHFLDEDISIFLPSNVADITLYALEAFEVDFRGNEHGISSMLGTITGLESYEVIANNHMFVYGWCYEVDGEQPNVIMSEFDIDLQIHKRINWFYGYAELFDGQWLSYCTPLNKNPRNFICKN